MREQPELGGAEPDYGLAGEDGQPIDLEALQAQAKPAREWTREQVVSYGEKHLGWDAIKLDHAWVRQVTEMHLRAYPTQAREIRRDAAFMVSHQARRRRLQTICAAPRQRPRERRPRSLARSTSSGRDPPPGGDDDPPHVAPRPLFLVAG